MCHAAGSRGGPALTMATAGHHREVDTRCSHLARAEPMPGTAPEADVWIAVEHRAGWGDAALTRTAAGVRVLMARGPRTRGAVTGVDRQPARPPHARVWVAYLGATPQVRVGHVADPREVTGWDLAAVAAGSLRTWGAQLRDPLLLVCANGRRDPCCGHAGRRLAEELWAGAERANVLTCTHLGGHRFAPTALVLPSGAVHGRLDATTAAQVLAAARAGWTPASTLRGFSQLPAPAQVADAFARRTLEQRAASALPIGIEAAADPGRLVAHVQVTTPNGAARRLDVPLVRVEAPTVASCGRDAEISARWVVG